MQTVLLVVVATVIAGALWKVRSDAASRRKDVVARMAIEREERGEYSPLAAVFREAGVDLDRLPDHPTPVPTVSEPSAPGDLRAVIGDMRLPAGLTPLGPISADRLTLCTTAPPAVVRAGLEDEFERIGFQFMWPQPSVLEVERAQRRVKMTIFTDLAAARGTDGLELFPGADLHGCGVLAELI